MLEFCTLGTGGTLPIPERALSSLYVRVNGRSMLIDCGEGTQVGIRRLGWGFRCLDGMLLTHYHGDHCTGLAGLLLSLEKAGRDESFHIFGPKGLKRVVEGLCVIVPPLSFAVMLHELPAEGGELEMIGLKIRAFPVDHGGIPCFGYRIMLNRTAVFDPDKARILGVPVRDSPPGGCDRRGTQRDHAGLLHGYTALRDTGEILRRRGPADPGGNVRFGREEAPGA